MLVVVRGSVVLGPGLLIIIETINTFFYQKILKQNV